MADGGKIVITGTGRAGTTFLVRLLTELGFSTGYASMWDGYRRDVRAGMEVHLDPASATAEDVAAAPTVVKDPRLCHWLGRLVGSGRMAVRLVVVPVRPLAEAAESRRRTGLWWLPGDMVPDGTAPGEAPPPCASVQRQRMRLAEALGELVSTIHEYDLPHAFLRFPRLVDDGAYCYDRLRPILSEYTPRAFLAVHERVARAV